MLMSDMIIEDTETLEVVGMDSNKTDNRILVITMINIQNNHQNQYS